MNLLAGYITIILIVIIYLTVVLLLYLKRNPSSHPEPKSPTELNPSIVTYSYLGSRGDMGNQMFQLACVIAAAKRSGATVVLPTSVTSLPINRLFDLGEFERRDIDIDASFHEYDNYEHIVVPGDGRKYDINGYRQAYSYFEDYASEIRRVFTPRRDILDCVRQVLPRQYIALHIRRGDYVKSLHRIPLLREFRQCHMEYYKSGIAKLRETYPNCPLLVCTDSVEWVKPLLKQLDPEATMAPVVSEISGKFSDFCTLYLADAVVMSNSTYSWMASYLRNNRIIVAPSPWWDPDGFIGTSMALDGPYLHHPDWFLLDARTGLLVRKPHCDIGDKPDNNGETLNIYRLIRGLTL